jgi:hypothetical protein
MRTALWAASSCSDVELDPVVHRHRHEVFQLSSGAKLCRPAFDFLGPLLGKGVVLLGGQPGATRLVQLLGSRLGCYGRGRGLAFQFDNSRFGLTPNSELSNSARS